MLAALCSCAAFLPARPEWSGTEVAGILRDEGGKPVGNAMVYAYLPGRGTQGPAEGMSEPTGEDGGFTLVLPAGDYLLVARRRGSGMVGGPLRTGDLTSATRGIPVSLTSRGRTGLELVLHPFRQGDEGPPGRAAGAGPVVMGKVVDELGKPVSGALVFAYRRTDHKRTPDHFSPPTSPDGSFILSLPEAGSYIIGARMGFSGPPREGDLVGFLGGRDLPLPVPPEGLGERPTITLRPYRPEAR